MIRFRNRDEDMRKIAVLTFITLDGVMQSPSGPDVDPSNGFTQGGWARCCWDEVMEQVRKEAMSEPYDMLCGRTTYDMFAANFPETGESLEFKRLNEAIKYVVTSRTDSLDWSITIPICGANAVEEIKRLKQESGKLLQIHGSWALVQKLIECDLIDEFRIWTFPVIVGQGKKLFESKSVPKNLTLYKSKVTVNGAKMAFYR
jgi:dihydrofolate reductase